MRKADFCNYNGWITCYTLWQHDDSVQKVTLTARTKRRMPLSHWQLDQYSPGTQKVVKKQQLWGSIHGNECRFRLDVGEEAPGGRLQHTVHSLFVCYTLIPCVLLSVWLLCHSLCSISVCQCVTLLLQQAGLGWRAGAEAVMWCGAVCGSTVGMICDQW